MTARVRSPLGRPRQYPEAQVGDRFGDRTVTRECVRGYRGRSDERVEWRCICGATGASYVHNMRTSSNACRHRPAPQA